MLRTTQMVSALMMLAGLAFSDLLQAQVQVTSEEAAAMYKVVNKKRISVHDPSVVFDSTSGRYYIFRSEEHTSELQSQR